MRENLNRETDKEKDIQVAIARRFHLFPFRTEKLSFVTPMVLLICGRVGSRRFKRGPRGRDTSGIFAFIRCGIYAGNIFPEKRFVCPEIRKTDDSETGKYRLLVKDVKVN